MAIADRKEILRFESIQIVTGTGYQFRYGFVLCIVSGYEFRRLVCLVSLFYVLF